MYFLSLLATFKNEESSLKLWLEHYLWMGVDHFYLIDNGSTDNSRKVLAPYEKQGLVSIFYLPEKYKQRDHYVHVYGEAIKNHSVWVIIADVDEFWYVKDSTLKKHLKSFSQYHVIFSKWRLFGSDGLIQQPDDIRVAITHRHPEFHQLTKCIFQTKYIESHQIQIHSIESESNQFDGSEIFALNHYPIQSWEYFQKVKIRRGDSNSASLDNVRDEKYFKHYDEDTTFEDIDLQQMILRLPPQQKKNMTKYHFLVPIVCLSWVSLFMLWFWNFQMKKNKKRIKRKK